MSLTGHHRLSHTLALGEKASLVIPLLKDDMKRLIGNLLQDNLDIALMVDLSSPVTSYAEVWQEVFVAKLRPEECEIDDLLHRSGEDPGYFLLGDMIFRHESHMRVQIYKRIG